MKILSASQIRELDQFTIQQEPIKSIDLMERAAQTFVQWFVGLFPDTDRPIHIYCGPGNNGGDGFAIARMLYQRFYPVEVFLCQISPHLSRDCAENLERLPRDQAIPMTRISKDKVFPLDDQKAILIDALFGSGLNRSLEGYWAELIEQLNTAYPTRVAIDLPSGVFADQSTTGVSIRAHYTFSFELPKFAFLFPENNHRVGSWAFRSIGLATAFIEKCACNNFYMTLDFIRQLYRSRGKYDHKGTFGHALLIVGKYGSMGAGILASHAALRSGVGLLTIHVPKSAVEILQISIPEAMVNVDPHPHFFTNVPELDKYASIGIGCGLGTQMESRKALVDLLKKTKQPMVLDADALNIIALEKCHHLIPANSILTPHPKEFERLFGSSKNDFDRNDLQRKMASKHQCYLILKGAHTCIADPEGNCYFNSTGNPGMATAGSGDVLTGILTALLAQGYAPHAAVLLGVFLHGKAGDFAAEQQSQEAMIASDIIQQLGAAFKQIRPEQNSID